MCTGACPLPESTKDSTAPRGTFATCGADGSVRLWHLGWEGQGDAGGEPGDAPIGGDIKCIRGVSTAISAMYAAPDPSRESAALREVERQAGAVADECAVARAGGNGLRCVAARPDGKELVVGDGCGNVRVFDLGSRTERLRLAAHDAEVLSVAYGPNASADDTAVRTSASSPDSTGFPFVDTAEAPEQRLVSSGRDGLVHVYDASLNSDGSPGTYRLEDTVDDHDAAVTGAVIAGLGSECKLVTTGADRKVIFRNLAPLSRVKKSQASKASKGTKAFASETMPRGVVHGVALDTRGKTCVTAGADGRLRLWSIANGKTTRAYPCADEGAGEALRVDADPHGRFAAVSHADKTVRVYDVKTGVLVGRCVGHGTAVTALAFMNCGSRLVTGGADGTVCVWRLPAHLGLAPARAPLRAVTNVSAAKCAVLVGTHSDGSLREQTGVNDRYAEAALVVKSVTEDATDADPALMNASGASSIPSLAFDELPKWAARAAANASDADESEKREREKLDNLAKVAAGSKWSANAPGGYVPKRTGLSASVLDHGDVDLEVDDDEDVDVENENSPESAAEKENAHPIAPGSVVSLYTPLDDDDDALYYAESEPGGDGSVPGTFGVVTVSPAHEQKSEHGLAAVDERDAPAEGAEGADTAVPKIEDAPAPDTVVQEDAAKPKGVFARVAAMLGGKKPASHLKTQPQDVQQPKPIQTPCSEPPRSESPTSHRGHRFDVPSGGEEDGEAEEVATEYETESDDEPPAVPLALRFDDDDESMGKHSDDVATELDGKQKENKALRESFSGRFRRRAREPLPLHELIDPKGDQPSDDNNEDDDDGRRLPVGDMVSAIEAVEREDANRATAAAGFAKGSPRTTPASNSSSDDDETNVVRKSVEELRASLPRLRTSPVERTRETPVEAAVTSSGENAEAESETKFEPDATWPPLPEDMPSDDDNDDEDGDDRTDANGEKEEKEEKEEPTSTTTPAVTTGDDEDATADAVRASIDAAVTHVEVELDATADDVDETADATAVKVEADVDATEPNATETCVATDGPIPSSEPSTLRSSQGGMTTGDRSSMRSSASSKGLRASLKKRRGRARRIIAAIAERTKRASLATSTNTSTDANANAKGAEGADTAVPRKEEPEPAEPAETLAKVDTDCPSNGPSSPEPAVSPVASTPAPTAVSDALAAVDALDDAVRRSLATVRASVGACDSDERQLVESRLRSLASLILGGGVDTSTRAEVRAVQTDEFDVEEHAASEPAEPSTSDTSDSPSPGSSEKSILAKMPEGLVTSFEVPAALERAINATMERALAAYSERLIETVRISVAASATSSR